MMSCKIGNRELGILEVLHGTLESGNEYYEVEFHVPENLIYFRGHFVGNPVLPGVVQLNSVALAQIESFWPDFCRLDTIRRLKFIHTIKPNDVVRMRLERKKDKPQVNMKILREGTCCTSAMLLFNEKAK